MKASVVDLRYKMKEILRALLQKHKDNLQKSTRDWQSANLSRIRASQLLEQF